MYNEFLFDLRGVSKGGIVKANGMGEVEKKFWSVNCLNGFIANGVKTVKCKNGWECHSRFCPISGNQLFNYKTNDIFFDR